MEIDDNLERCMRLDFDTLLDPQVSGEERKYAARSLIEWLRNYVLELPESDKNDKR